MKNLILTSTLLVLTFLSTQLVWAGDSELPNMFSKISFVKGTFENFQLEAAKQQKPMMILFCRTGCHTCTQLNRGVSNSDVSNYFNRYFFSYFVDADKEKFKLFPLTEKFKITATPFFVFLTPDGRVIYKGLINPDRDTLLEKCTQIISSYINYRKVSVDIAAAQTPDQQKELATQLFNRFKSKIGSVTQAENLLNALFLTSNNKQYKTFNNAFMEMAVASVGNKENGDVNSPFSVDQVASNQSDNKQCTNKRAAKWVKWANE